jgi:hypothetical protein
MKWGLRTAAIEPFWPFKTLMPGKFLHLLGVRKDYVLSDKQGQERAARAGPSPFRWQEAGFPGADDGTRTRDPHLGKCMADVSCIYAGLTSVPELPVLGALVSCVSADRWSRPHFVGDFVGADSLRPPSAAGGTRVASDA